MTDATEVILKGFTGLDEKKRNELLKARCGGLAYVPPAQKKINEQEEEHPNDEQS